MRRYFISGNPRGQGRPRAYMRGRHAGVYESREDKINKENIAAQVVAQDPEFFSQGVPVELNIAFYLSRPKAHYNSKGELKERFTDIRPTVKPDCSNVVKGLEDALNGILWHDDSQIVKLTVLKNYTVDKPFTVIEVGRFREDK